jgi:peroxiredoxin
LLGYFVSKSRIWGCINVVRNYNIHAKKAHQRYCIPLKMIAIASGNTLREVEDFKKKNKIPYPILADQRFDAHSEIGSPRTPYTIWVRRDAQGKGIVVSTHLGAPSGSCQRVPV